MAAGATSPSSRCRASCWAGRRGRPFPSTSSSWKGAWSQERYPERGLIEFPAPGGRLCGQPVVRVAFPSRMKQIRLAWVVHFHQPLGNFGEVLRGIYRPGLPPLPGRIGATRLRALLAPLLRRPPGIPQEGAGATSWTRSGSWPTAARSSCWAAASTSRSSAWIPREDAEWQLRKTIEWMQKELGYVPRGAWLPESVWEPHFVELLHRTATSTPRWRTRSSSRWAGRRRSSSAPSPPIS